MGLEPGDATDRGGQGAEVFRLAGSSRILHWAPFVLTVVGLASLVAAVAADDRTGAGIAAVITFMLATSAARYRKMPHQIRLDHEGLEFVALAGTRSVEWRRLQAIEVTPAGMYPDWLRWRSIGGSALTASSWERQDDLRSTVEGHAPWARLDGP